MKKVILNLLPPAPIEHPSLVASLLKKQLIENGFNAETIYWNLKFTELRYNFLWMHKSFFTEKDKVYTLLFFFNYMAIKKKDRDVYLHVKAYLMQVYPAADCPDADFYDQHMKRYAQALDQFIDDQLNQIDFSNVLCFSFLLNDYQWIVASIISEKIKIKFPTIPIIIGGINTKSAAIAYIDNYDNYDFAIWGDGEESLTKLCRVINSNFVGITEISNVVYRSMNCQITLSKNITRLDVNLSDKCLIPDYSDYFLQMNFAPVLNNFKDYITLLVDLCGENQQNAYHAFYSKTKYRNKPTKFIIEEIRELILEYNVYKFIFINNDIIVFFKNQLSDFINKIIEIKEDYSDFRFVLGEIATKEINAEIIRKMALAGLKEVQIRYVLPRNNLSIKNDERSSFGSNLLFIKFAVEYDITISSINVTQGLMGETNEDIMEGIDNLHMLRFYFADGHLSHNRDHVKISNRNSHYEKYRKDKTYKFVTEVISNYLPTEFFKVDAKDCNMLNLTSLNNNELWNNFFVIEKHYLQNQYSYKLIRNDGCVIYREYYNGLIVKELELNDESLELFIMNSTNGQLHSLQELFYLYNKKTNETILELELISVIEELKRERLIYVSNDYLEILSLINVNKVV